METGSNLNFLNRNLTSLSHSLCEVRHELGTQQLSEFLQWYKSKNIKQGLFPTYAKVEELLIDAEAFYNLHGENANDEWYEENSKEEWLKLMTR